MPAMNIVCTGIDGFGWYRCAHVEQLAFFLSEDPGVSEAPVRAARRAPGILIRKNSSRVFGRSLDRQLARALHDHLPFAIFRSASGPVISTLNLPQPCCSANPRRDAETDITRTREVRQLLVITATGGEVVSLLFF